MYSVAENQVYCTSGNQENLHALAENKELQAVLLSSNEFYQLVAKVPYETTKVVKATPVKLRKKIRSAVHGDGVFSSVALCLCSC